MDRIGRVYDLESVLCYRGLVSIFWGRLVIDLHGFVEGFVRDMFYCNAGLNLL